MNLRFDGVFFPTNSVATSILLGALLAVGILVFRLNLRESITGRSGASRAISYAAFAIGLASLLCLDYDISIRNGFLLAVACALSIPINLALHFSLKFSAIKDTKGFWFFKRAILRRGYYEHKDLEGNSYTSRFGLIVIGRNPERGMMKRLLGCDGWSTEQKQASLRHERGHVVVAIPMILLETLIFYCLTVNLIVLNFRILLLIPALIAAITLVAWLDEFLADCFAGFSGFSLQGPLWSRVPKFNYLIGSIGADSHPPVLLRYLAFLRTYWMVALAILAARLWLVR